jgi:hypothetical protein
MGETDDNSQQKEHNGVVGDLQLKALLLILWVGMDVERNAIERWNRCPRRRR